MRRIEERMVKAIEEGKEWSSGNTAVTTLASKAFGVTISGVFLHDNHIANVYTDTHGKMSVHANKATLLEWPTPTTMSRLRALGVDVCRRNNTLSLEGFAIAKLV